NGEILNRPLFTTLLMETVAFYITFRNRYISKNCTYKADFHEHIRNLLTSNRCFQSAIAKLKHITH
ncbi:MAG: hypothetical protein FWG79_09450, partial [Bacteroidales bacterium]|nr:hypothetical protein [Bacteroidales bacterium]